ncbi:hypothetical protein [Nocardia crassostreae]|uniref:hypothetical protein n=1 Tax=Nocardia crassostreae TaxID=53428 RepID=UPI0008359383|nr:hypothetical protein [Nocardia crassostreae]
MLIATLIVTTLGFIRRLRRRNGSVGGTPSAEPSARLARVSGLPAAVAQLLRSMPARVRRGLERIDRRYRVPVAGTAVTLLGVTLVVNGLATC